MNHIILTKENVDFVSFDDIKLLTVELAKQNI
jgi:hypothetical protein